MTRRRTYGERIADRVFLGRYQDQKGVMFPSKLARDIDRLIRKRMAEAWEDGWFSRDCQEADWDRNPYRGRRSK